MSFKDHFSSHAGLYARSRPHYPEALFAWLAGATGDLRLAWDCGAGSGQASVALAGHFRQVVATDASAEQIAHAPPHPSVRYRVERAEASSLPDRAVDLVFVSQALHWFELAPFYAEVRRVAAPGGLVCAVSYVQVQVDEAVDSVMARFGKEAIAPWWPPERRHVEQAYATLPFPFPPVRAPSFTLKCRWRLEEFRAYIESWSAVRRMASAEGVDPVAGLLPELAAAWGDPERVREVCWPLVLKVGRADAAAAGDG